LNEKARAPSHTRPHPKDEMQRGDGQGEALQ
jgi:hypothetical protein